MSSVALNEWVALNSVPGMGARSFLLLLQKFGSPELIWKTKLADLHSIAGVPSRLADAIARGRENCLRTAEQEVADANRSDVRILTLWDAEYPPRLRQIYDPPPVLYVQGEIQARDEHSVALVGTRRITDYGRSVAERFSADLAKLGMTVVSGLARGVDSVSHTAALRAKGRTLAVLGSGILHIYPPENRDLAERIVRAGALVSEFPLHSEPQRANFPIRNRIISALSRAVVVIEGDEDSGAMITADCALEQGRDVFAVPGNILRPTSRGPHKLLRAGCLLAGDVRDILEGLGYVATPSPAPVMHDAPEEDEAPATLSKEVLLDEEERRVFRHLTEEPVHIDDLMHKSGVGISRLGQVLTLLELKGVARQEPGMRYARALS